MAKSVAEATATAQIKNLRRGTYAGKEVKVTHYDQAMKHWRNHRIGRFVQQCSGYSAAFDRRDAAAENSELKSESRKEDTMRYIITHKSADNSASPVSLLTYAAEIAGTAEAAADQFLASHPDRAVVKVEPVNDVHAAFERYGLGAWTDEEQQAAREKLQENYAIAERERKEAEQIVLTYEPDELEAAIVYRDRRATEKTPNIEGVHVGDLFYVMWGYEQTNYDFFQVVGLRGKHTIVVRQNDTMRVPYGFMCGLSRPIRNRFKDEQRYTMRTRFDDRRSSIWINAPEGFGRGHTLTPCEDGKLFDYTCYA